MPTQPNQPNILLPFRDALLPLIWPAITRINSALQAYPAFRVGSHGLTTDDEQVVSIGLTATKLDLPVDHVTLSFGCGMICFPDDPDCRLICSVLWSRSYYSEQRAGFSIYESRIEHPLDSVDAAVKTITEHFPTCEERMLEAIQRGCPPDEATHLLHRKTRGVPPALIDSLNRRTINCVTDLKTFAATYDLPPR